MILQQLERDYERILRYDSDPAEDDEETDVDDELTPPSMYEVKPVRWKVLLDTDGAFVGVIPLTGGGGKRDRGKPLPVPSLVRTVNVAPLLFADTAAYMLGLELEDKNAAKKHQAFRELVAKCAASFQLPWMDAVCRFLDVGTEAAKLAAVEAGVEKSDLLTFDVSGIWPIDQPEARAFWAENCGAGAKTSAPKPCLVCGKERPAVESMPFMIKGIPNGQTSGTALVSANLSVFESYGLKRATTSPICAVCAERFSKALKALIKSKRTHQRVGALMYTFWTVDEGTQSLTYDLLNQPKPEDVRALFRLLEDGMPREVREAGFYGLALSANAARIVVRDWLETTVGQVLSNLARWLNWIHISDEYGAEGQPLPIWRLVGSLYRPKANGGINTEDVDKQISEALYRAALHGDPIPMDLLYRAVLRNRLSKEKVTYERASLTIAVLRSQQLISETDLREKEEQIVVEWIETGKELTNDDRARLCGQLLAVLEELQNQASLADNRKINTTLIDRYYGTASSAPASVFGTLLSDAQAHLGKLRKVRPGAYDAIQRNLENIQIALDTFPSTLNMRQQAMFSLGYYKQRGEQRRARAEAAINRRAQADRANDSGLTTETEEQES